MTTITTRRFLISAMLACALGLPGVSSAGPFDANNPQPPSAATMRRGRLGISVLPISEELREKLGAARDRGVLVDLVRPDSPAAKAGLRVGDVITAVDGDAVQSAGDITGAMSDRKRGQSISLVVVRDGRPVDLTATLDDDPAPRAAMGGNAFDMPGPGNGTWRWLREPDRAGAGSADSADMQRQLEEARKRLDNLEQRLDKLERR